MVFRVLVLVFEHAAQSSIFAKVQDLSSHILFSRIRSACMTQLIKFSPELGFGVEQYMLSTSMACGDIHI